MGLTNNGICVNSVGVESNEGLLFLFYSLLLCFEWDREKGWKMIVQKRDLNIYL